MPRIKLIIEYDGSDFVGWQIQPNGISVQQRLEEALAQLAGETIRVHSSGRTDAGVHALRMVCHFDTARELPLSAWREGTNRFLPQDIAVRQAEVVADDFHARFAATGKCYRYTLLLDEIRSPLQRRNSWQLRPPLDLELMREAARQFVGEHDFAAFRTSGCAAETTRREIFSVTFHEALPLCHIDIEGSGFLKNMVRMMVGTLVEIGRGKRPLADIEKLLRGDGAMKPVFTAPPQGLCLRQVHYQARD